MLHKLKIIFVNDNWNRTHFFFLMEKPTCLFCVPYLHCQLIQIQHGHIIFAMVVTSVHNATQIELIHNIPSMVNFQGKIVRISCIVKNAEQLMSIHHIYLPLNTYTNSLKYKNNYKNKTHMQKEVP